MNRYSNGERTTILEKASSRDVFEKASSTSPKLTKSSSELERKKEFPKFSFDSVLLGSKVYRRTCESSWIQEMSTQIKHGDESNISGPTSINSVSAKGANASDGDCGSSPGDFVASYERHCDSKAQNVPYFGLDGEHEGRDMLKVSGLGLTEFRSPSFDPTVPETRGHTDTYYGATKLKCHSSGHRFSFNLEIWSFGCIMLALAWWLASWRKEPKVPELSRYARILESLADGPGTLTNELQIHTNTLWDVL